MARATLNAADKLTQARTNLIFDEPFFGTLALRLQLKADPRCPTAYTDGKVIGYSPAFVDALSLAETTFMVAHETLHCAMGHPWRREWRDPFLFNVACDFVINLVLKDAKFTLTQGALLDRRFAGMSAEQVYQIIREEVCPKCQTRMSANARGGGGQPDDQGDGPCDGQGKDGRPCPGAGYTPLDEVLDASTSSDAAEQAADWEVATIQAAMIAKSQGKLPAALERVIDEIRRPRVDWRSALMRFVQQNARDDFSWRLPNSRYVGLGVYMPGMRSDSLPPIVLGVDTSGSITQEILSNFAGALQDILDTCKPECVHVVYCDAAVKHVDEFAPGDLVKMKPHGGGGTDFRPVFDWVAEQGLEPACLIYLTDMYGTFPEEAPEYPVLWATTELGMRGPWGDSLDVEI